MNNPKTVLVLLRIGLATVYLYAGISAIISPQDWIAFLPLFLKSFMPLETLLLITSVTQILLALWLLSGLKAFYAGIASAVMILGIILLNLNALDITFRDFTVFFASLALALGTFKRN